MSNWDLSDWDFIGNWALDIGYFFVAIGIIGLIEIIYLTGSNPPLLQGLQRMMRHRPFGIPIIIPYFKIACLVYCEQVGSKRQVRGLSAEAKNP